MTKPHYERRSRGEIDRNFFLGDVLIKTGVATAFAILAIAVYTPFSLGDALAQGMYPYLAVMGGFGLAGIGIFVLGRHLRHEATHWDMD